MLVLLPPSEGKADGGRGHWKPGSGRFGRTLRGHRVEVVEALQAQLCGTSGDAARKLFGVKGDALDAAIAADSALLAGPPTLPAAERYTGVVMTAIDSPTLAPRARDWYEENTCIVSGLHGLVGVTDPVPAYRLKMGASLTGLGKLSTWWRPHLDTAVARHDVVVDLLANEQVAAFTPAVHPGTWIRVEFVTADGKLSGHFGKEAKGHFARTLAEAAPESAEAVHDLVDKTPNVRLLQTPT